MLTGTIFFFSQIYTKNFKLLNEGDSDKTKFNLSSIHDSLSTGIIERKFSATVNEEGCSMGQENDETIIDVIVQSFPLSCSNKDEVPLDTSVQKCFRIPIASIKCNM